MPETNPKANKIGLVAHGISKPWASPWHKPKTDTKIMLSFVDSFLSIAIDAPNKMTDKIIPNSIIIEIIELLNDAIRDLKGYDLELRIQELESKFSKDLSETTFNELQKELKKKQNLN